MSSKYRNQLTSHVDVLSRMYSRNNRDDNELAVVVLACNSFAITAEAKDLYINEMENYLRLKSVVSKEDFYRQHLSIKAKVLEMVFIFLF